MVWYSHLFCWSFPQFVMMHTVKGFSIVNETEADIFLEFPYFLHDPVNVGNLISGSSAFFKPSSDVWKFSVHITLKPRMQDFEHNLTSIGNESNCPVVCYLQFFVVVVVCFFKEITNICTDVEKWEPYTFLVGMQNSVVPLENSLANPQKVKHRLII